MFQIWRKYAPLYITHMMTFSMMAVGPLVGGWKPHTAVLPGLMLPVWIASSVLWTEREGSEELLRALPLTNREVVASKFTLLSLAVVVYWFIMMVFGVGSATAMGSVGGYVSYVSLSCVGSLIVGALCYIGMWFFGKATMTFITIAFMIAGVWVAISVSLAGRAVGRGVPPGILSAVGAVPWPGVVALMAVGLVVYYTLSRAAVRVRDAGEAF